MLTSSGCYTIRRILSASPGSRVVVVRQLLRNAWQTSSMDDSVTTSLRAATLQASSLHPSTSGYRLLSPHACRRPFVTSGARVTVSSPTRLPSSVLRHAPHRPFESHVCRTLSTTFASRAFILVARVQVMPAVSLAQPLTASAVQRLVPHNFSPNFCSQVLYQSVMLLKKRRSWVCGGRG